MKPDLKNKEFIDKLVAASNRLHEAKKTKGDYIIVGSAMAQYLDEIQSKEHKSSKNETNKKQKDLEQFYEDNY